MDADRPAMDPEGPGQGNTERARMEGRFGALGSGFPALNIRGRSYSLEELLHALGLGFEDIRPIDAHALAAEHFAVRYVDPEEWMVVAYEFDAAFRRLGETAVHVSAWTGDRGAPFPWASTAPGPPPQPPPGAGPGDR